MKLVSHVCQPYIFAPNSNWNHSGSGNGNGNINSQSNCQQVYNFFSARSAAGLIRLKRQQAGSWSQGKTIRNSVCVGVRMWEPTSPCIDACVLAMSYPSRSGCLQSCHTKFGFIFILPSFGSCLLSLPWCRTFWASSFWHFAWGVPFGKSGNWWLGGRGSGVRVQGSGTEALACHVVWSFIVFVLRGAVNPF